MKTIKLPYNSNYNTEELQREYSSVVRYAYNRFHDGCNQTEIRKLLNEEFEGLEVLDKLSFIQQQAIREAQGLFKKHKDYKIVFGSKRNFIKRQKGEITNTEWKKLRLRSIIISGEKRHKGNRHFKLDMENNCIIFKMNRNEHYTIELPNLPKKRKQELLQLQKLCEKKHHTFSISIDDEYIRVSFENFKPYVKLNKQKYIGVDLNPSNIGISIIRDNEIIETKEYNFSKITQRIMNLGEASDSKQSKYLQNKLNHELLEISNDISQICKHHRCKFVFVENLKSLQKKATHNKGKKFNRLIKNLWIVNKFISNLQLNVNEFGGYLFKVYPQYSSFIGNMKYSYTDAVNASIEIARRGYNIVILKNKEFYPELTIDSLKDQWKEYLDEEVKSWKELYNKIKNTGLKYRVSWNDYKPIQFKSETSFVDLYLTKSKYLV